MSIALRGIWKSFGEKPVLRDVSLLLPEGSVTGLMGPSGCGKTTLLRIVLGLLSPDRGSVTGVPERCSAVFQEDRLCPGFSAAANVRLVTGKSVPPEKVTALLEALGLQDCQTQPAEALSGGQRRRAALARALLAPGELLVLDEPFQGLDETSRERAAALVRQYTRGRTVLFVTHDRREAELLGGRLCKLPGE